jgi:hypothetical protein
MQRIGIDKFQEGLSPSCEESKECKEKDKQIVKEGCRCSVIKSKECKETDRQIPEEACRRRGKERKKYLRSARHQRRRTWDSCQGSLPHLRRRTRDPCPGSAWHQRRRSWDPCQRSARQHRRREEDPGSIPGICNGAIRRRRREKGRVPYPGSSTRRSQQWRRKRYD